MLHDNFKLPKQKSDHLKVTFIWIKQCSWFIWIATEDFVTLKWRLQHCAPLCRQTERGQWKVLFGFQEAPSHV